jgi:hypothetical protein
VARHAVVINDLVRSRLHLLGAYAGWAIFKSRITRHDAVASVWRAYTAAELAAMISAVHLGRFEIDDYFFFRMGAVVWV